jgi:hypothetical protein
MKSFLCVAAISALAIDFTYTVAYWLIGLRPHRLRRYLPILALLSTEAALIRWLVDVIRRDMDQPIGAR